VKINFLLIKAYILGYTELSDWV